MKMLLFLAAVLVLGGVAWYLTSTAEYPNVESNQVVIDRSKDAHSGTIEFYDGISASINVEEIDLSGRNLTGSLKAEIRSLSKLEVLNLSDNSFTGLPAEVGQLQNLVELNLSNNSLTGLPHEIGNLQNLRLLDLTGNSYSNSDLEIIKSSLPSETVIKVQ